MFFDELVSRLKKMAGDGMIVYSREFSAGVLERICENEGFSVDFEIGRLIFYQDKLFYLSIRNAGELKMETGLQEIAEDTAIDLFAVNKESKKVERKLVISLKEVYTKKASATYLKELIVVLAGEIWNQLDLYSGRILSEGRRDAMERDNNENSFGGDESDSEYGDGVSNDQWISDIKEEKRCYNLIIGDSAVPKKTKTAKVADYVSYPVLYGTNRKKTTSGNPDGALFGKMRDNQLNLGMCEISIPKSHRLGKLERPNWFKDLFFEDSPEKYFTILNNEMVDQAGFIDLLKKRFADSGQNDVLLFVHGYNVKFKDAMFRSAQLGYDLNFKGAVTAFSWPSEGALLGYLTDSGNAEYSTSFLGDYIKLILRSKNVGKLHILAHSMGNVVLCGALRKLKEEGIYPDPAINQVILAAPDIDKDVFVTQILPAIKKFPNLTLYASQKDKALIASKKLRSDYSRLGEGGQNLLVSEGLDSIDASEVDTDFLGHGYFSATQSLLNEIHMVLLNIPPERRMLNVGYNADKKKYWILKRT